MMTDQPPQGSAPPDGETPSTDEAGQAPGPGQPVGVPPPAAPAPGQAVPGGQLPPGYTPPGAQPPPPAYAPPGAQPPPPAYASPGAQPPPPAYASPGAQPPGYAPQPGQAPPPGYVAGGPPVLAQPVMLDPSAPITQDDKLWAAAAHASMFVFGIFGPLIIMMVYKEKSHYITFHAKQALIFQIIAVVGGVVTCGLLSLVCMVFAIMAAIKAFDGQYYTYPGLSNVTP